MTINKVLFRVDGTPQIGSGHIIRSVALAQALKSQGAEIEFLSFCPWPHIKDYIVQQGFKLNPFPYSERELGSQKDLEILVNEIKNGFDWVVLDNYHFELNYQKAVKQAGARLLVIDDTAERSFNCDLLLNHGLQAKTLKYDSNNDHRLLLGTEFALIRQELLKEMPSVKSSAKHVLVTLGGGNQSDTLKKIIEALGQVKIKGLSIKVLSGFSENFDCQGRSNIEMIKPAFDLSSIYKSTDFAICAGGGTAWELCYFGIPGIVGVLADNQVESVEEVSKAGAFQSIGWYRDIPAEKITKAVENLLTDLNKLSAMRKKAVQLVDGKGPQRIIKAMQEVESEISQSRK